MDVVVPPPAPEPPPLVGGAGGAGDGDGDGDGDGVGVVVVGGAGVGAGTGAGARGTGFGCTRLRLTRQAACTVFVASGREAVTLKTCRPSERFEMTAGLVHGALRPWSSEQRTLDAPCARQLIATDVDEVDPAGRAVKAIRTSCRPV